MVNLRNKDKLYIVHSDIFSLEVEAIVNPTNTDLLLGAGLGGKIRRKGGSEIQEECLEIHSIPPGRAAVTSGGALKCRNIIHAAIMKIGGFATEDFIVGALKSTANRLRELKLKSVAIPPLGVGVARFPIRRSAELMIETILDEMCGIRELEKAFIVLDDVDICSLFEETYTRITGDTLIIEIDESASASEPGSAETGSEAAEEGAGDTEESVSGEDPDDQEYDSADNDDEEPDTDQGDAEVNPQPESEEPQNNDDNNKEES